MSFGVRQTWVCSPGLLLSSCQLQFAMCEMGITATSHSEGGFDDSVTGIPQYSLHMWSACVQQALFPSLVGGLVAVLWRVCRAGQEAAEGHLCQPLTRVLSPAFSQVVENTAFFGDVVLRFPRIVHHYFDHNSNWNLLIRWGISFCNQSGVFDQGPHSPILGLVRTGAEEVREPSM